MRLNGFILLGIVACFWLPAKAQSSLGVSGLLTSPSAEMQPDGNFMMGANYVPSVMLPEGFDMNTGTYYFNLTFLPFAEICYRCTLSKPGGKKANWMQDRAVSLRLRALKEKKYVPAVVVGSNDAFTTRALNPFNKKTANRMFGSVYGVLTKNISLGTDTWGVTVGYYLPLYNKSPNEGIFGGLRYTPGLFPQMSVLADYDGKKVSGGVSLFLFQHIRMHVMAYGFRDVSAGIRYELILIRKKRQS